MHRRFEGVVEEGPGGEADPPVGSSPHLGGEPSYSRGEGERRLPPREAANRLGARRNPEIWLTPLPPTEETNFKRFGIK